ncbi:methyltransferase [Psychromonas sp. MME2]|uniref:methyltransferase n=1 Tax=Psychromonas sp. MME2 TaxID=3231033 RepID=UPI00339C2014
MTHSAANSLHEFNLLLVESCASHSLKKMVLSKYRGADKSLQRITIKPILLQNKPVFSFLYQHQTNHITKNHSSDEAIGLINSLLESDFKSAYLSTSSMDIQLDISKKGKAHITKHKSKINDKNGQLHDREKHRFVDINRPFLQQLGVTDKQCKLIPAMSRKWKQINKFIEVFSQALETSPLAKNEGINVVDFGSGKGYLTFAIHDYLRHTLHNDAQVTGVELRQGLADLCNKTALTLIIKAYLSSVGM